MNLVNLIERAYRHNGVITAYIYGDFGFGKTSYALWVGFKVLGSWDKVLKHLFFHPEDAMKVIGRAIDRGERLKIIIMDDAGLWLDRLTWWEESKVSFMKFFNLIRSVASGVLFTTPSQELPKQIIRKCMIRVRVRPSSKDEIISYVGEDGYRELEELVRKYGLKPLFNIATGYKLKTLPSFTEFLSKEFYDIYPLHYPIYEEYERKRREALKKYFKSWKEAVEGSRTKKEEAYILAKEMLKTGMGKHEVVRKLRELGINKVTSYRLVNKLLSVLEDVQT